ncbi:MAG: IS66 family transposase [Acidimicrobiales bacterium]
MARAGDNREAGIAELELTVARLESRVEWLAEQNRRKDGVILDQMDRIADLEKALEDAHRRSKRQAAPFSKGDPKPEPERPGRKPGESHGRHEHRPVPPGPPDRDLVAPLPGRCPDCGGSTCHDRDEEQWKVDVPEPRVVTTRFTVAVGHCADCARRVQGRHPEQVSDALGAAGSQVGPVAKATASWLHYGLGLSFGRVAQVLARLGTHLTAGAICRSSARSACTDLVPVHRDLVARADRSKTITMDESGWRVGGAGGWLWVAANDEVTLCWVAGGRGSDQATEVIASGYDGVLVRDGYVVYDRYKQATHQSCTAHILRRCHEMEADLPRGDAKVPAAAKAVVLDALARLNRAARTEPY